MSKLTERNVIEVILGGLVILVAVLFVYFSTTQIQFTTGNSTEEMFLKANFSSADGIKVGSEVRIAGVKIGSVANIDLNKEDFLAIVELRLYENYGIPEDSEVIILSDGLLGQKYIDLNVGGSPVNLMSGDTMLYSQGSVDLINLLNKFSSRGD